MVGERSRSFYAKINVVIVIQSNFHKIVLINPFR